MNGNNEPVRSAGRMAVNGSLALVTDIRRFRVKHALRAVEDALILLDQERGTGVELRALERIRADLAVVLRIANGNG